MFIIRNGEPTDWAIISNKYVGGALIVTVYIGLIYIFVILKTA